MNGKNALKRYRNATFYFCLSYPYPIMPRFKDRAYRADFSRKRHRKTTENSSIHRNGERSCFHAKNEQKTQAGMAVFLKSPKPYGIQSALPEMCPRLQAEFPGRRY